jgi:hypothetical protein
MTDDELKRILARNPALSVGDPRSIAAPKRGPGNGPLAAPQAQKAATGKLHVRITSRRVRLADPDGLFGKYLLDCCRYAGWLIDDSAEHISYETRQEKVAKKEAEETLIEIFQL